MADARALLTNDRARVLEAVPAADQAAAGVLADKLVAKLESVSAAIAAQDADVTATRLAAALEILGQLELLQSPGLAYILPAAYADRPKLLGRATAEFVLLRGGGGTFSALSDGQGPQRTARVVVTLDGYNAPLTAGNAAQLIDRARPRTRDCAQRSITCVCIHSLSSVLRYICPPPLFQPAVGFYNGVELAGPASTASVFAAPRKPSPLGYAELPLELRAVGEYEPRYRVPLDALGGGEMPVLPISVYGAVAALRGDGGNDSSPSGFFFYLYDRRTSGLGGLSFDEGQFSVFGYVTAGAEVLQQLRTGDKIQSAKLVAGKERLVVPPGSAAAKAAAAARAEQELNAAGVAAEEAAAAAAAKR